MYNIRGAGRRGRGGGVPMMDEDSEGNVFKVGMSSRGTAHNPMDSPFHNSLPTSSSTSMLPFERGGRWRSRGGRPSTKRGRVGRVGRARETPMIDSQAEESTTSYPSHPPPHRGSRGGQAYAYRGRGNTHMDQGRGTRGGAYMGPTYMGPRRGGGGATRRGYQGAWRGSHMGVKMEDTPGGGFQGQHRGKMEEGARGRYQGGRRGSTKQMERGTRGGYKGGKRGGHRPEPHHPSRAQPTRVCKYYIEGEAC